MKKTLLLFAMLLGVVGAWAQEDTFVTPEAGKFYIIKGDHATHHWLTGVVEGEGIDVSDNKENAGVYYYDGTSLKLYNSQTYIGKNGDHISLVGSKTNVTITSHGNAGKYIINVGGHNLYNNQSDYTREAGGLLSDPGNNRFTWGFIEKKAYTIDNFNATNTTWTKYDGTEFTSGWGYKVVHNATNITIHRIGTANDLGWSTKNNIRYPYLVRNKSYLLTVPDNIYITDYQIETTNENSYNGDVSYTLTNNEITIALTNGDAGNNTAGVTIRKITLFYIEREECNYVLTDNAANQYQGTYSAFYGVEEPTLTGSPYELSNKQWNEGTFTANITFPVPVSSETVANPTFISTYNYNQQAPDHFKWYASDNKIKVKEDEEIDYSSIASHLWLIYPKFNNGAFTFQIKNVATDLFINSSVSGDGHDDESTVILSNESTEFTEFTIGVRNGEGHEFINSFGKSLSVNTSKPNPADKIQTVGTYGTHPGTALTFPTPEFNVTIGSAGYATLYSPITVRPEDQTLEIYQIEFAPENGRIELTQMFHVYKNQGVILKGAEGTYRFGLTNDYWEGFIEKSMWDNNKLKGSFTNTYVEGDAYVLAKPTIGGIVQEVGLYKALLNKNANGETDDTHFLNNAGKAYLPASALSAEAAESRFFLFGFGDGEETGITETEYGNVKTENTVVYDLAGRRVQGAQKGIFIVNGKKVVR